MHAPMETFFHNPVEPLSGWPAMREEDFAPLPDRYRRMRLWVLAGLALAPVALAFGITGLVAFYEDGLRMPWMAVLIPSAVWLLLATAASAIEYKAFPLRGFQLRAHDLTFRRGLIFSTRTTVPFNRVQHSEVAQGPLQRVWGLSTLKVYTAGSSGANLSIAGLDTEVAQTLRQTINDRIGE